MNLQRCVKGHFYDAEKYRQCPHCDALGQPNVTVGYSGGPGNDTISITTPLSIEPNPKGTNPDFGPLADSEKTIGYFKSNEPVTGWLVCTKGVHFGKDFRLKAGRNFIGRNSSMDICLSEEKTVSKEKHAIVIYEPKQNTFMAQAGESKELFYVNDEVVLTNIRLKKGDRLQIGNAELMFIPCCDDSFSWPTEA